MLAYDSKEQLTSGVLIEAIAAGLPVAATAFPHARELLSDGSGLLVPHRDPEALASGLESRAQAVMIARRHNTQLAWPVVAAAYDRLAHQVVAGQATSVA